MYTTYRDSLKHKDAQDKRDHAKKAKTAQQQRLAKAEDRLAACEADQPTPS